jgi:hypothetical protein
LPPNTRPGTAAVRLSVSRRGCALCAADRQSPSPSVNVCRTLWPAFAVALQLPHPTAPTGSRSSGARLSDPRSQGPADLYAPRWIKGIGIDKMAVCPVCFEDGDGYQWHKTKVSQYKCVLSLDAK